MNISERIILDPQEQATIRLWAHGKSFPLRLVQRAQIIQMAADGIFSHDIACRLGISRPTVQLWRQRFLSFRCAGLEKDAPRPGRIPKISKAKILYNFCYSIKKGCWWVLVAPFFKCKCTANPNPNYTIFLMTEHSMNVVLIGWLIKEKRIIDPCYSLYCFTRMVFSLNLNDYEALAIF